MCAATATPWWKDGIIYQIYPRSFQDTTGSGIGDLDGIRRRLGHVADLGVDAIWISPIYPSPMKDAGYDITDYTGIEPIFGSVEDFERLADAVHDHGLKLLLDLVPSHSSDRHPWFMESRSSRDNPKRDWYIWRDPAEDGGPPSNWIAEFGGSAWEWDEATGQYYLHIYMIEQPALNWRNPDVRAAIHDAMRAWFGRGVDGFRVDAVEHLAPDHLLRDNPPASDWTFEMGPARSLHRKHSSHQPDGFSAVREMRKVADEYPDRVLVGEAYGALDQVMLYYGEDLDGFQLPFNFHLIEAKWEPLALADYIDRYEAALPPGGWPNWVLGNHDRDRVATRWGPDAARVAAMLLLTLKGTPTIWQGDELGMVNEHVPDHMVQDPWAINNPGTGLGRDPVRIPIPWDDGPGRGFTTGEPWLPLSSVPSAEAQVADPTSMLALYRDLTDLRRIHAALRRGGYTRLHADEATLAYARACDGETLNVALNFSKEERPLPCSGTPIFSTISDRDLSRVDFLLPHEGLILEA
ncbi:alpha-amylase family glycosyl hydrolase [Palleronia sp. LCG004]|uniref:alpha-amylase family glycosyl hydrolase n=1 Tax=Palleronia sp. LCG004 TaxID=3079304 RepID=UPI002941F6B0|nr:alpha-amylase family glycosyl hydrolase [Palleronia sp. LCG004]WOI57151.1 alpha-amylase family glycosyl hydrolase [Palleronia sp. LCG004]